jgi:hypothetical protein
MQVEVGNCNLVRVREDIPPTHLAGRGQNVNKRNVRGLEAEVSAGKYSSASVSL